PAVREFVGDVEDVAVMGEDGPGGVRQPWDRVADVEPARHGIGHRALQPRARTVPGRETAQVDGELATSVPGPTDQGSARGSAQERSPGHTVHTIPLRPR